VIARCRNAYWSAVFEWFESLHLNRGGRDSRRNSRAQCLFPETPSSATIPATRWLSSRRTARTYAIADDWVVMAGTAWKTMARIRWSGTGARIEYKACGNRRSTTHFVLVQVRSDCIHEVRSLPDAKQPDESGHYEPASCSLFALRVGGGFTWPTLSRTGRRFVFAFDNVAGNRGIPASSVSADRRETDNAALHGTAVARPFGRRPC
jgi:hypothetical protein